MATSFFRTILLYFFIILTLRLMGKRQVGELQPSELVVMVMISELAAIPMQDSGVPLLYGILPILILLVIEIMMSYGVLKSVTLQKLVCGVPIIVIENGRIVQQNLKKNRFTVDELIEELRMKDITDLSKVKYAILETTGNLSTILYASEMPVTPRNMSLKVTENGMPIVIINDGKMLENNLKIVGHDKEWLDNQLKKYDVTDIRDVFLLTVDELGCVYFARRDS